MNKRLFALLAALCIALGCLVGCNNTPANNATDPTGTTGSTVESIDYATEARLRSSLSELDYSPTIFIISQRASSIMHADKIIVLDDGNIVGIGKHKDLLNTCEIYKEIYNSQFTEGGASV